MIASGEDSVGFDEQQREKGTEHGAEHVCEIEKTERSAISFLLALADGKHRHGNCRAHAGTPWDHGRGQAQSGDGVVCSGGQRCMTGHAFEQTMPPNEFRGNDQSRQSDQEFEKRVEGAG